MNIPAFMAQDDLQGEGALAEQSIFSRVIAAREKDIEAQNKKITHDRAKSLAEAVDEHNSL